VLAEELGDVVFVSARGVVFVHPERAEHIVRELHGALGVARQEPIIAPPAGPVSPAARRMRQASVAYPPAFGPTSPIRWRAACGSLGIMAGTAVFVAALAVPLDDPALVVALGLWVRGGRQILDVDS
jgi:hypothetical protein